jgi:acrylyl-CoA reductase (NADPH)
MHPHWDNTARALTEMAGWQVMGKIPLAATPVQTETLRKSSAVKAHLIDKDETCKTSGRWETLRRSQLDAGELTLRILYSSVNYKDALAATGAGKIIRRFPCVGGIYMIEAVVDSQNPKFKPGELVIATSFDLGVAHHGGYAEEARVPAAWAVPLPHGLTPLESMALGTAGFTAGLAIARMEENGLAPTNGLVIVSGATGGVGSLAINMLAQLGYEVVAHTCRTDEEAYLKSLGAARIQNTMDIDLGKVRPMEAAQWAGAVDNLGGLLLHWMLANMKQAGTVASIGNAASVELHSTVFPFILRGVSLLGIDSGYVGFPTRGNIWQRLANDLKPSCLAQVTKLVESTDLAPVFDDFIAGRGKGRTVVRIGGIERGDRDRSNPAGC